MRPVLRQQRFALRVFDHYEHAGNEWERLDCQDPGVNLSSHSNSGTSLVRSWKLLGRDCVGSETKHAQDASSVGYKSFNDVPHIMFAMDNRHV